MKLKDLTGQRFGHLEVLERAEKPPHYESGSVWWLCRCDCGNTLAVPSKYLLHSGKRHCGCMRGKKTERFCSNDAFGCVLNCAVRYALGRRTYMPSIVVGFITPLLPELDEKTLCCFERDLDGCYNFGDPNVDEPMWRQFQRAVKAEIMRRANL